MLAVNKNYFHFKKFTILIKPLRLSFSKRFMWRNTASKLNEKLVPTASTPSLTTKQYSTYAVTEQESSQDTSKVAHPTVVKQSCDKDDCNNKNCAKDPNDCDLETQTNAIVAHITHSLKGVEAGKTTLDLSEADVPKYAVVYEYSEAVENLYQENIYAETQKVQQDENTEKLNESTKNQKPLPQNEEN